MFLPNFVICELTDEEMEREVIRSSRETWKVFCHLCAVLCSGTTTVYNAEVTVMLSAVFQLAEKVSLLGTDSNLSRLSG